MQYTAHLRWNRNETEFTPKTYDRTHEVKFGGGVNLTASSAGEFFGKKELPNPEELFVAAINSCFMLTLLYWASTKNLTINHYEANATGTLAKNSDGKMAITEVHIQPSITFEHTPEKNVLADLYKKAHENCFISASVKSKVIIEE